MNNYRNWLGQLDQERLLATTNRSLWIYTLIVCVSVILLISHVPQLNNFIQLRSSPPLIVLAILSPFAWAISDKPLRQYIGEQRYGALALATSCAFQSFMWSMVTSSGQAAAPMLTAFPILLSAYHSEFFLLSKKYLWGLLPTIGSLICALLLSPTNVHTIIILVGGSLMIAGSFVLGGNALIQSSILKERNDLREALEASTLMDSVNETEKAKDLLYEMMGANHDAGNAITGVLMNLELLTSAIESRENFDEQEVLELNEETRSALTHLVSIIEEARELGKQVHEGELVHVNALLDETISQLQSQFSDIDISLNSKNLPEATFIKLHGGSVSLNRVLTNLVKNASEGDGQHYASKAEIHAKIEDKNLTITVRDNGPGFKEEFLNNSISTFRSSKESGSGLGLYTCKRLVMGNKGDISLANNDDNTGAAVTLHLPLST